MTEELWKFYDKNFEISAAEFGELLWGATDWNVSGDV